MKKKIYEYNFTLPLILALAALVVLLAIYLSMGDKPPEPIETTTEPVETAEPPEENQMPEMQFKSDLSAYEAAMTADGDKYLVLINKQNKVGAELVPSPLVKVKDTHKDIELEATVARALEAMFIEMRACGYGDVFVTSAYRSHSYQTWLFNYYIEEEKSADRTLTDAEARERVLHYSAAPGTSEHQSGLAVDLMTNGMRELDESFATYPVYTWLLDNAWKFGFVLRFPSDKTDVTGYDYEPWHYRFVGRENAYAMWKDGLCLEEFLEQNQ